MAAQEGQKLHRTWTQRSPDPVPWSACEHADHRQQHILPASRHGGRSLSFPPVACSLRHRAWDICTSRIDVRSAEEVSSCVGPFRKGPGPRAALIHCRYRRCP